MKHLEVPMPDTSLPRAATLYRMVLPEATCPSGVRAKALLEQQGYAVDDRPLTTRADVDAFKAAQGVATTPQVFIDGARIGGFDDLSAHFGVTREEDRTTYAPVIALFALALAVALAMGWRMDGTFLTLRTVETFIAAAMVLLGLQKLQDPDSFARMFAGYDLLARRWPPYGHVYPWAETGAGVLMLAGALPLLSAPVALFIATIGAVSVYKAVYIERRALRCACVGGDSRVPLGFVSL
ncbi:MAG: MauE/DoxX family redox-associated membrane protein, partial [Pseudomonadota bacterium]